MEVNPRYARIVDLMAKYDAAPVGSKERNELGAVIDREGSRLSERDRLHAESEYARMRGGVK